jgi:hypothetical protein
MPNITITPLVLEAPANKPGRLFVRFFLNEGLSNAHVRLIVYDERLYAASRLGQRFEGGKEMRKFRELDFPPPILPTLADEEANPQMGAGSGVLLKLEGRVMRTQGIWFFDVQDAGHEANTEGVYGSVELHMLANAENARLNQTSQVALISYLKDDVRQADGRYIMRMVLLEKAIEGTVFNKHEQILSSLNPKHNRAHPARHQIKLASLEVKKSAKLPGGAPPPPEKASATSRLVTPDLTGLWEAEPAQGKHPVLHIQINQAGHQAVGWFNHPAAGQEFKPPALAALPAFDGVFQAYMNNGPMPSEGWPLTWSEYDKDKDADPNSLTSLPAANPGRLRVLPGQSGTELDLEIEVVFESAAGKATVKFVRYDPNPRWSNAAIAALTSQDARDEMVALHRKPIPSTYWLQLSNFCTSDPKLIDAISNWEEASAGPVRRGHGETVARLIDDKLTKLPVLYHEKVLARFRGYAANHQLTSRKGTVKTLQAWIDEIVAEEFDHHRKAGLSDKDIYQKHMSPGFRRARVSVPGKFIYTATFEALIGVSGKVVVGGGLSSFMVKFKKEEEVKGGRVAPPPNVWNPNLSYFGFMGELGAGLMIGGGTPGPGGASAQPGTVEFKSAFDLKQEDFDHAYFSVVALNGPSGGIAGFSFTVAKVSGITLSLQNGFVLSAVVDKVLKPSTPSSIKKPKFSFEFNIVNVSMATGFILLNPPKAPPMPKKKEDIPSVHKEHKTTWLSRTEVQYEHNHSVFTDRSRNDLETSVAVERVWFTIGDGFLLSAGYASPEGTRHFNDGLTKLRARNALQGVQDALGPALKLSIKEAFGLGEEPSYSELLDPPSPDQKDGKKKLSDFSKADQERLKFEQANFYVKWRKTELSIQGSPVILLTEPKMGL